MVPCLALSAQLIRTTAALHSYLIHICLVIHAISLVAILAWKNPGHIYTLRVQNLSVILGETFWMNFKS